MTPERKEKILDVLNRRQDDLTVVLENVFDPHNISAVMRSCDAVGIQDIYVLNTRIPRHKKWGAKSSSSAHKWMTVHQFTDSAACFEALREKYGKIFATCLSPDAISIFEMDFTGSMALVFGNEHEGVSPEIRSMADGNLVIPQVGMIRSLNISVACAVSLYEAFRQKMAAGHYLHRKLSERAVAGLMNKWGPEEQEY
jgi:tRNA (guanosine-2'-O-)-methyltransferase